SEGEGHVTGGGGLGAEGLDDLLRQTSELLGTVRAGRAARDGEQADRTGTGEAADGRVQATVGNGDQLTALRWDPRSVGLDSETLCGHIVEAVNAAVADLREQGAADGIEAPAVDTAELSSRLDELRTDSVRQMVAFTQAMDDVLSRMTRGSR